MLRISNLVFILFIVAWGVVAAQENGKIIVGAHVEWEGTLEPEIKVNGVTQTLEIDLQRDKECVTVYSPPENKDYTVVVKTRNGIVTAGKPHPQGFQARFCYNIVGQDQILRVHLWLGRANFVAIDGTQRMLQAEQYINFVLPRSGKMQYVEGGLQETTSEQGTARVEEDENRFGPIRTTPVKMYDVVKTEPQPAEQPAERPAEQPRHTPAPQPREHVARPGEVIVPGYRVDIPTAPEEDPNKSLELQKVQLEGDVVAADAEIAKYYKEKEEMPKPAELPWYQNFELDHSEDMKIHIDGWLGYQKTRQTGSIRMDSETTNARGTTVTLEDGLGMEDRDSSPVGGFDLYLKGAHFGFDASHARFDGLVTSTTAYTFGDTTFAAGSLLDSEIEHRWYRINMGYTHYLNRNFGVGFDMFVEYWRVDFRINNQTTPGEESFNFKTIIPSGGLHFDWSPKDRWLLTLEAHGTWFDINDTEIWMGNATAWVRFFPCQGGFIFLRGEWEIAEYDLDDAKDVDLNLDFYSTWNVSGGVGFRF